MATLLNCTTVHGIIEEPSKRNLVFPFLTACPDFIVDASWGEKRELVVVEVKHSRNPTELGKYRNKNDAYYQVQAALHTFGIQRGILVFYDCSSP